MFKKPPLAGKGEFRGKRRQRVKKAVKKKGNWIQEAAFGKAEEAQDGWKKDSPKWSDLNAEKTS